MTLSDALVIYFTCGSPFAVHVLMTDRGAARSAVAVRAALSFVGWPAAAARQAYFFVRRSSLLKPPTADLPASLIKQIENAADLPANGISVFDVRDTLERYTGLAAERHEKDADAGVHEIFKLGDHPAPEIASACLSRRTRERFLRHLTYARAEFVALIAELADGGGREKLPVLAFALAEALGDEQCLVGLRRIFGSSAAGKRNQIPAGEVEQLWSTEQAATTAN